MDIIETLKLTPLSYPFIGHIGSIYFFKIPKITKWDTTYREVIGVSIIENNNYEPILPFLNTIEEVDPNDLTILKGKISLIELWDLFISPNENHPDGSMETLDYNLFK